MKSPRAFSHVDTWVFDLDNTLYPHHVNLWQQVDRRIGEFVGRHLKISAAEARVIQKDYYRRYGTTMRGMMTEHGISADDFLAYVHQIDHSPLEPNPAMGAAIAKLPGRKLILTNGSSDHADRDAFIAKFVHDYNRTRLKCLAYKAPIQALANQTGPNTFAGTTVLWVAAQ